MRLKPSIAIDVDLVEQTWDEVRRLAKAIHGHTCEACERDSGCWEGSALLTMHVEAVRRLRSALAG